MYCIAALFSPGLYFTLLHCTMYCMAARVSMDSTVLQYDVAQCSSGVVLNFGTVLYCTDMQF